MSTTLDDRARAASAALRSAVAEADLRLGEAGVSGRPAAGQAPTGRWALAGATAAVVIVVGLFAGPSLLMAPAGPGITAPPGAVTTTSTSMPATTTTSTPVAVPVAPPTTVSPSTTIVDVVPPVLEITEPADGSVVEVEFVTFRGITEPGARVFAGRYEATVASDGRWELGLVLTPGTNTARFTAGDAAGNIAEASVSVRLPGAHDDDHDQAHHDDDQGSRGQGRRVHRDRRLRELLGDPPLRRLRGHG
jgi:hypothetical protein